MASAAPPPPGAPPPLTPEQLARIRRAPIHRRIKHLVYSALGAGVVGAVSNITCVVVAGIFARNIVQLEKWFIFHYTCAAALSLMWLGYSAVFMHHIKFMTWPDQLQIDMGWMMFSVVIASAFLFYLYRKMQQYGVLEMFVVACSSGCTTRLRFIKLSPLILGITTLALGALQLLLALALYRNPIINPPLDEHGAPIPQDPETGKPLPLDASGQPILPAWLRPPATTRTVQPGEEKKLREDSSAGEESEEEKALLNSQSRMAEKELGRTRRGRGEAQKKDRRR